MYLPILLQCCYVILFFLPRCQLQKQDCWKIDAMILGVGNDVQDALLRQTIGIQPYISFPRTNDGPVQWVQLLNGSDQQGSSIIILMKLNFWFNPKSRLLDI